MHRRLFLAGMLAASPLAASQPISRPRRISVIGALGKDLDKRLRELGFVDGRDIALDRQPWDYTARAARRIVDDAVKSKVDVIVACGSLPIRTAIDATRSIPIVMAYAGDPIGMKFVSSLARPGGNVTGMAWDAGVSIAAKTVETFREAVPDARAFAMLGYAENPAHQFYAREAQSAFARLGLRYIEMFIKSRSDIAPLFQKALAQHVGGIIAIPDHMVGSTGDALIALALSHNVPVLLAQGGTRPGDGVLIAYGPDISDHETRAADYVGKILRGAKPGELAVEQSSRITLAVNLKAAQRLKLRMPDSILVRADEVIR